MIKKPIGWRRQSKRHSIAAKKGHYYRKMRDGYYVKRYPKGHDLRGLSKDQVMGVTSDSALKRRGVLAPENRFRRDGYQVRDGRGAVVFSGKRDSEGNYAETAIKPKYEKQFKRLHKTQFPAPAYSDAKYGGQALYFNTRGKYSVGVAPFILGGLKNRWNEPKY